MRKNLVSLVAAKEVSSMKIAAVALALFAAAGTSGAAVVQISNVLDDIPSGSTAYANSYSFNLDHAIGAGNSGQLVGSTRTLWKSGSLTSALDLNGNTLLIDTGNGNSLPVSSAISGSGIVNLQMAPYYSSLWANPLVFSGTASSTYTGTTNVNYGEFLMDRTGGAIALNGNITVGESGETARLVWGASNQLGTSSNITVLNSTVAGTANPPQAYQNFLDLGGATANNTENDSAAYTQTISSLTLDGNAYVDTGTGAGGVLDVSSLTVGGVSMGPGSYTSSNSSFVTGTGSVVVAAVPEPATLGLLGIASMGLLARRKRKA